jgi:ABC-type transporter Mla subunit MlaD
MNSARAVYLRVGLLLVIGTAAAITLVLFLSGRQIANGVPYESYFQESVQGLEVGAPVKFRGVTVGQVRELGLVAAAYGRGGTIDPNDPSSRLVYVRYIIDPRRMGNLPDRETAVAEGLRSRLASQGITGLTYLELDFVDPHRFPAQTVPWTPRGQYIPSMPSTISQVQSAAEQLVQRLKDVDIAHLATTLQAVLDDVHGEFSTGDAHQALAEAAGLLHDARADLARADLAGLAATLRSAAAGVHDAAAGKPTQDLLAASARAADRLAEAAAKLPPLIAALDAATRRASSTTADVQADLMPVLRDARAAAANLRDTSDALRRYPAGVLLGGPPPRRETP